MPHALFLPEFPNRKTFYHALAHTLQSSLLQPNLHLAVKRGSTRLPPVGLPSPQ